MEAPRRRLFERLVPVEADDGEGCQSISERSGGLPRGAGRSEAFFAAAKQSSTARFVGQERYVEQAKQALQTAPATPSIGASEATNADMVDMG